jgi:hypothetical protein
VSTLREVGYAFHQRIGHHTASFTLLGNAFRSIVRQEAQEGKSRQESAGFRRKTRSAGV